MTMSMTVEDPSAFVANANSKAAVEEGIAAAAGVERNKVDATLTVGSRRLQGLDRRLQGTVDVSAEIEADNAGAVAALQESVNSIEPAAMTTSLNSALADAGLPTVAVSSLSAAAAPALSPSPGGFTPPSSEDTEDYGDSGAGHLGLSMFVAGLVGLAL